MKRGVRVVTIRGVRVAVDAMALRARGIAGRPQALSWGCERSIRAGRAAQFAYGKTVWSWHPWLVSNRRRLFASPTGSRKTVNPPDDGGKRNSSPGRARHKPSNHCAGKAGCSPLDLYARVRTSLCHCTRDRGCSAHPVFPAPSHDGEGQEITHNSGVSRREIEDSCALLFQRWRRSEPAMQIPQEKARPQRPGFFIVEVSDRGSIRSRTN